MFGAAKRAHHRQQEEMRRQTAIRNAQEAAARQRQALEDQMRAAREREARFEQQNQVLMAQLQEMTIQNKEAIANQQAFYTDQLAQAKAASDQQIASLEGLMVEQRTGFERQLAASQAAFNEQQRISRNVASAYIPEAQATASGPILGSSDNNIASTARKAANNELSQLSIVSGANPVTPMAARNQLAGLQIA